jgi:hypothetical protein
MVTLRRFFSSVHDFIIKNPSLNSNVSALTLVEGENDWENWAKSAIS